jgi:hypothetical protein
MKGRIMKILTGLSGCFWALTILFSAGICRADDLLMASMGNILAMSDVNQSLAAPNLDGPGGGNALRDQKQDGVNYSARGSAENNDFSYADVSESPGKNAHAPGDSPAISQNSNSPFDRYLLIVILGGVVGLVMLAAGIAQYWRRRSIGNYWLFPAVGEAAEPAATGTQSPALLIPKKPLEILPEEKTDKHAQRRAA